jgi:uncharacterized C2H2 Zn-finger protein
MSEQQILQHLTYLGRGKGFQCNVCQKIIATKASSKRHVTHVHLQPPELLCQVPSCNKVFRTHAGLAGHVLTHTNLPPTKCPHPSCKETFVEIRR